MALRCRKGDMAIVLSAPYGGSFVSCIEYVGRVHVISPDCYSGWMDNCWETTFPSHMRSAEGTNGRCAIPDEHLLPIRPGDLDESEENEKTLEFTE